MTAVHVAHAVHVVLPEGVDDPDRPSGGNVYDRRLCRDLAAAGWSVAELPVAGPWPARTGDAQAALAETLAALPDG
ncbi:MAG: glycosyltransferase family 1 protein, partial [Nocardioidaceae bacterium]|nr:glycosyltransferase family 1 protein [Nocardioidaceae bacterium]